MRPSGQLWKSAAKISRQVAMTTTKERLSKPMDMKQLNTERPACTYSDGFSNNNTIDWRRCQSGLVRISRPEHRTRYVRITIFPFSARLKTADADGVPRRCLDLPKKPSKPTMPPLGIPWSADRRLRSRGGGLFSKRPSWPAVCSTPGMDTSAGKHRRDGAAVIDRGRATTVTHTRTAKRQECGPQSQSRQSRWRRKEDTAPASSAAKTSSGPAITKRLPFIIKKAPATSDNDQVKGTQGNRVHSIKKTLLARERAIKSLRFVCW